MMKTLKSGSSYKREHSFRDLSVLLFMVALSYSFSSCKHEPLVPVIITDNNGNGGGNGGGGNGLPCDPDSIYFQQQILPFIITNCAKSGCHNATSAQGGVVLDSHSNVMSTGGVTPFNLGDSDLWEVINETDPNKMMPPPGENPLTQVQIDLISQWINQGALNLVCDDGLGPCDSTTVSFIADVQPIMQNKCVGCHTTANSGNAFIELTNYTGISATVPTGQLVGSITHDPDYSAMPQNGPMLSTCEIAKIRNWVSEGALNN